MTALHAHKALVSGCSQCDVNQMLQIRHIGYRSVVALSSPIVQITADMPMSDINIGLTLVNNATNPSDEKSESEFESVEESDFKPSSADDNRRAQPAKPHILRKLLMLQYNTLVIVHYKRTHHAFNGKVPC